MMNKYKKITDQIFEDAAARGKPYPLIITPGTASYWVERYRGCKNVVILADVLAQQSLTEAVS